MSVDVLVIYCSLFLLLCLLHLLDPSSPFEDDVREQANEHGCQGGAVDGDEILIETPTNEAW